MMNHVMLCPQLACSALSQSASSTASELGHLSSSSLSSAASAAPDALLWSDILLSLCSEAVRQCVERKTPFAPLLALAMQIHLRAGNLKGILECS